MKRVRMSVAALGVAAVAATGAAAITSSATASVGTAAAGAQQVGTQAERAYSPFGVDEKLKVPAGNKLAAVLPVERGVQTYQCTNGAWTFLEPNATLINKRGVATVLHTRGPVWISTLDGSAVNAAVVPGATVPRPNAIPELLLKSTANRGEGQLGKVSFIQRLETKGGVAPTGSCKEGTQVGVPYQAKYTFYVPSH